MATWSNQSVTIPEVLDAMTALLRAATGFNADQVIEWHRDQQYMTDDAGNTGHLIWFQKTGMAPDVASGAGRSGFQTQMTLAVNLITRGFTNSSQRDKLLGRKHLTLVAVLLNAFMGRMLHDAYAAYDQTNLPQPPQTTYTATMTLAERLARRAGDAGAVPQIITTGTMVAKEIPPPKHYVAKEGQVQTTIEVSFPIVLRLTLDDAAVLEE